MSNTINRIFSALLTSGLSATRRAAMLLLATMLCAMGAQADDYSTPLTLEFPSTGSGGTVTIKNPKSLTIKYSTDGGNTKTASSANPITITVTAGQAVQLYGNGTTNASYGSSSSGGSTKISCSADCYIYGNIMSLVDETGFATNTSLTESYTFAYLFNGNSHLKNHSSNELVLPATTLANYCYNNMFSDCTSLTTAPALPATMLAVSCYNYMFSGCTGLTQAPALPATSLADGCYNGMFNGTNVLPDCSNIDFKNENVVASGGLKGLFAGTAVTDAQLQAILTASGINEYSLPATTLADNCYRNMFNGCTKLTKAPELPATTLAKSCYFSMFYGCTGLTAAPELPATTLAEKCYFSMFLDCTNLNYVKCLATDLTATSCTSYWLNGVAETGTFVKAAGASWGSGDSGIPSKWTVYPHVKYTIHYDANGGTGTMSNQEFTYDVAQNLRANTFTAPEDKVFTGWNTESDGSGTSYSDQESVFGLTTEDGATITLYAQWAEEKYTTPLTLEAFNGTVKVTISNQSGTEKTIKYLRTNPNVASTSTPTLSSFTVTNNSTKEITLSSSGDYKLELYGNGTNNTSYEGITISCSTTNVAECYIYGNIMSLVDETGFATRTSLTADNTFKGLFSGNTLLTNHGSKPLLLPATSLTNYCYYEMFKGCTGLTTAPELPAKTLELGCYTSMFQGCTNLTTAPELPATTLTAYCYKDMFSGCTNLTTAPALPAKTLTESCYQYMFYGCTGLTTAPELPATSLAVSCYDNMFSDCTNLTKAPELPATTLAKGCYQRMFQGCTGLTAAPALPATTLTEYCYRSMFTGSTKLNYVKCLATDLTATDCTTDWLISVAQTGTFVKNNAAMVNNSSWTTGSESGIPSKWTVYPHVKYTVQFDANSGSGTMASQEFYCGDAQNLTANAFTAPEDKVFTGWNTESNGSGTHYSDQQSILAMTTEENATIILYAQWAEEKYTEPLTLQAVNGGNVTITNPKSGMQYTINGGTKIAVTDNDNDDNKSSCIITVSAGDKVQFYGNGTTNVTYGNGFSGSSTKISCSADCYIYGNIMSLVDEKGFATNTSLTESYTFAYLFSGNSYLKNHATKKLLLPATTLATYCYAYMFYGCTGLTTAPALPAKTLEEYCYSSMFQGCSSLTTAPDLPAETLAEGCYQYMFQGCKGLTQAPALPAKTLAESCYQGMFNGCTKLTKAPELPATTLAKSCYSSMFQGCTGLTAAPELPVETLANFCYSSMFYGCTGLTAAPALPATTLEEYCYSSMFYGCTKLNYVKCLATDLTANNCTTYWLYGVAQTGTFVKVKDVSWTTESESGIPSGWTVEEIQSASVATEIHEESVRGWNGESDVWYDLQGRKLNGKPTKKGIYIVNGRKVLF